MRRYLLVAFLLLFAGCSGLDGTGSPTPSLNTESPTQTITASPTDNLPAGVTASNTVTYSELTPAEQQAFDEIKQGTVEFAYESVRESPYVNRTFLPAAHGEVFMEHDYVKQNDTYYRISRDLGSLIATYSFEMRQEQPPENATIVSLDELSPRVREPIQKAIQNGSHDTIPGRWDMWPQSLDTADYVRDGENYYNIRLSSVGDIWPDVLSVTPVE